MTRTEIDFSVLRMIRELHCNILLSVPQKMICLDSCDRCCHENSILRCIVQQNASSDPGGLTLPGEYLMMTSMQILVASLLVSTEKRMLRCNPARAAGPGDSNVRELIQSEERLFRVFEGAWLFQALESFFEKACRIRAEAFKCF